MIERLAIALMFALPLWLVLAYIVFKIGDSYLPKMVPNKKSNKKDVERGE